MGAEATRGHTGVRPGATWWRAKALRQRRNRKTWQKVALRGGRVTHSTRARGQAQQELQRLAQPALALQKRNPRHLKQHMCHQRNRSQRLTNL